MKYTFSVIIPIYNLDKYIKESIDCVINQTIGFEDNIQLILVDDGSTDFSASICRKYVDKYPDNITYVYQKNQGASAARNTGIEYANGKYLMFFDGDDLWEEDAFSKIAAFFDEHYDEIDVVACRIKKFEMSDDYVNLDYRFNQGTRIVDIHKTPWVIHPNVTSSVFKASAIKDLRFDTKLQFGEDAKFLALLIAQRGKFGLLKEVVYLYRKRFEETSLTQSASDDVARHLNTSEFYYKELYQYSRKTYGKVLPFFQHLMMNAFRFRLVTPAPKNLTKEQTEQYRENLRWVMRNTADGVILNMKRGMRNTRLYMLWLKHGDEMYKNLSFADGTMFYKGKAVGSKLESTGILRVDDIEELNGKKKFYGAVQLSAFLPQPSLMAELNGECTLVALQSADIRSKKSFQGDDLYQVYTWEIEVNEGEGFPECKLVLDDYELPLVPAFPAEKKDNVIGRPYCTDEEYIQKVIEITGAEYEYAAAEMNRVRKSMGASFEDYFHYGMYNLSDPQKARIFRRIAGLRKNRAALYEKIINDTGMNKLQIDSRIAWINRRNIYAITLNAYAKFELYNYSGKMLDEQLSLLARRDQLKDELQDDFSLIDAKEKTYADIQNKIDEIYSIYEKLIPESLVNKYADKLQYSFPEICSERNRMRHIAADIEFCLYVLGFYVVEYICFRFAEKTLAEKREFIGESELVKVYKEIHTDAAYDVFNDKKSTYDLLKEYYQRDVIKVSGEKDRAEFTAFCNGKDTFVFKPVYGAMGRGIGPVCLADYDSTDQLFDRFNEDFGEWIAEELINQHEVTKRLNPDSVNTIRLITYYDGRRIRIHRAFAKIGRGGSFVDNGGSGGIFVTVDHKKGIFTTDGCDENGVIYEKHPETGVTFKGYKLPKWRKALKLGKKIANKVEGACYVGWDLALTDDNEWIVVEGNSRTQFVGQQCTTRKGEKKLFMDLIYKK